MDIKKQISDAAHESYYAYDINCANTTLNILSELFHQPIHKQVTAAAAGMHGAGGFRAQCGLVEGALMFIGIFFAEKNMPEEDIISLCYDFGESFTEKFGSLRCYDLRPGGFRDDDPPHLCEDFSVRAIYFSYEFVLRALNHFGAAADNE